MEDNDFDFDRLIEEAEKESDHEDQELPSYYDAIQEKDAKEAEANAAAEAERIGHSLSTHPDQKEEQDLTEYLTKLQSLPTSKKRKMNKAEAVLPMDKTEQKYRKQCESVFQKYISDIHGNEVVVVQRRAITKHRTLCPYSERHPTQYHVDEAGHVWSHCNCHQHPLYIYNVSPTQRKPVRWPEHCVILNRKHQLVDGRHRIQEPCFNNKDGKPYKIIANSGAMGEGKTYQTCRMYERLTEATHTNQQIKDKIEEALQNHRAQQIPFDEMNYRYECHKKYKPSIEIRISKEINTTAKQCLLSGKPFHETQYRRERFKYYLQAVEKKVQKTKKEWKIKPAIDEEKIRNKYLKNLSYKGEYYKPDVPDQLTVMVHTCRIQQGKSAYALLKEHQFMLYNNKNSVPELHANATATEKIQYTKLKTDKHAHLKAPCVIYEMESLYKQIHLDISLKRYLNVMDEIRSLMATLFSFTTHGHHLRDNVMTFIEMIKLSNLNLAFDADLECDPMISVLFGLLFPTQEERELILIERYPLNPDKEALRDLFLDTEETAWLNKIQTAILEGKRIFIALYNRSYGKKLEDWFQNINEEIDHEQSMGRTSKYPKKLKIKFYHGKDHSNFTDFDQLNTQGNTTGSWSADQVDIVMCTAAVTVSADCQEQFHILFLQGNGFQGPTARDLLQTLGRIRFLCWQDGTQRKQEIHALVRPLQYKMEIDRHAIKEQIMESLKSKQTHLDELSLSLRQVYRTIDKNGTVIYKEPWFIDLYAIHLQEKREEFTRALIRHSSRKGYTIHWCQYSDTERNTWNPIPLKVYEYEQEIEWYDAMSFTPDSPVGLDNDMGNDNFKKEVYNSTATAMEQFHFLAHKLHVNYQSRKLTSDEFLVLYKNPALLHRIRSEYDKNTYTLDEIHEHDIQRVKGDSFNLITQQLSSTFTPEVEELIQLLGFKDSKDFTTIITKEQLQQCNHEEIERLCRVINTTNQKPNKRIRMTAEKQWLKSKNVANYVLQYTFNLQIRLTHNRNHKIQEYRLTQQNPEHSDLYRPSLLQEGEGDEGEGE